MWQPVIDKCYKCACDWLTLKYLWPIMVETDAMSQIDIDNTCYVGDRSCNDGSQKEREGQVNYRDWSEVHQSWRLVAKKRKGFVDGQCHFNPWLGESSCRYWFQERVMLYKGARKILNKGIETMTKTVMVNWAVMVFICRQSEPARPRACHSFRTAFTRRHTMWHCTLDTAFV